MAAETSGPPYAPRHQGLGGTPAPLPDVPVSAVFLALFVVGATLHMGLFQVNKKHGKKFVFNAATFGFCFTRIIATSLRIAWSYHQHNISLGMAAQIFVYAGVIILFIANLFFAQRIVRAQHPSFGWSRPFSLWLPVLLVILVATILSLISAVVVQFYVDTDYAQTWTRDIQLYGDTLFAFAAFLPIPIVIISCLFRANPWATHQPQDSFGSGKMRTKVGIVLLTSTFLSLGQCFRTVTTWLPPVSTRDPAPWYFSKLCFYLFDFTIEISVVFFFLAVRIDKRYVIPDGAHGMMSYGNGYVFAGEKNHSKQNLTSSRYSTAPSSNYNSSTTNLPPPRVSYAGSQGTLRNYMSRPTTADGGDPKSSKVSWGGYVLPVDYTADDPAGGIGPSSFELQQPPPLRGVSHEMGYNRTSGNWEVRSYAASTSHMTSIDHSSPSPAPFEELASDDQPSFLERAANPIGVAITPVKYAALPAPAPQEFASNTNFSRLPAATHPAILPSEDRAVSPISRETTPTPRSSET